MPDATPVRRSPRKAVAESKPAAKADPDDPRIGETVEDERWRHISFSDAEYRVEDGVIVERL